MLTAKIVAARIGAHALPARALPGLIRDVYETLASVARLAPPPGPMAAGPARGATRVAMGVEGENVFADHLVCLDCGLSMKMLKRHLQAVHHMTPEDYRTAWNLPPDYPMVARDYAALRSDLAKESGLGKRPLPRGRAGGSNRY